MAKENLQPLRSTLESISTLLKKDLRRRDAWGELNFEQADLDFKRAEAVVDELLIMPLEILPDNAIHEILSSLNQLNPVLDQIDKFKIATDNSTSTRSALILSLHTNVDALLTHASKWIPYLAYQRGDVAKNISSLTSAVSEGQDIVQSAKDIIAKSIEEIEKITSDARSAAAEVGISHFKNFFDSEATLQRAAGLRWLGATAALASFTLLAAVVSVLIAANNPNPTHAQLIQYIAAKLIVLSMLFTATIWCGRIYKATLHQAAVNRHRSLSLLTFMAFNSAASDEQTKNAVLLETTRTIFGIGSTGYLDDKGHDDGPLKVVEIMKSIGKATSPGA